MNQQAQLKKPKVLREGSDPKFDKIIRDLNRKSRHLLKPLREFKDKKDWMEQEFEWTLERGHDQCRQILNEGTNKEKMQAIRVLFLVDEKLSKCYEKTEKDIQEALEMVTEKINIEIEKTKSILAQKAQGK